jgi:hypothetical protein
LRKQARGRTQDSATTVVHEAAAGLQSNAMGARDLSSVGDSTGATCGENAKRPT